MTTLIDHTQATDIK